MTRTVEPPATAWEFPDPRRADDDVVCQGGDLQPGTLLSAYRAGLFPMPIPGVPSMCWWSPVQRGILPLAGLKVSRSLRRSTRRFHVTVDEDFPAVLRHCAQLPREGAWIDRSLVDAYTDLHHLGWAHSVETRDDRGDLVGGLYGVSVGGLFAGESMFHLVPDASKVALVALVDHLRAAGDPDRRLLDVQWCTPHLQSLGAQEVPRQEYLARLPTALALPLPEWG